MKHILNYINEALINRDLTENDFPNQYLLCRLWDYMATYTLNNISSFKDIVKVQHHCDLFFITTKETLKQIYWKAFDEYGRSGIVLGADNSYSAINIYAENKRPVLYCAGDNFNEEYAKTFFIQGMKYYCETGRPWKVPNHEFLCTNNEIKTFLNI